MSYTIVTPSAAPIKPNEVQLELDTGQTIAVSYKANSCAANGKGIIAEARQIDPTTGDTIVDALGHPVQSSASHAWCATDLQSFGATACIKDVMLAVLGEPPVIKRADGSCAISQNPDVLAAWSIRTAIANSESITHTSPSMIL